MPPPRSALRRIRTLAMLPLVLLLRVGNRVGLSKPIVGLAFRRMFSLELKQRAFAGYQPTRHDVFVATFGKSGTNWMMQIALQIAPPRLPLMKEADRPLMVRRGAWFLLRIFDRIDIWAEGGSKPRCVAAIHECL